MMRSLTVMLVLLLAGAVVLSGCGATTGPSDTPEGTGPASAPPTAQYFPLAVGNEWTVRTTTYTGTAAGLSLQELMLPFGGQPDAGSTTSTSAFTITGTQKIGGAKWFRGGYTPAIPSMEPVLDRHTAAGLRTKVTLSGVPYYLLKAPIQVGTKWSMPPLQATRKITKVGATTKVPAGTFGHCVVVKQTYSAPAIADMVVTYWFARGTGVVRTEVRRAGVRQTTILLTSATILGG